MKKFYSFLVILFIPAILFSQNSPERILGTFVYKQTAYNFEFTREDENNYSFRVSTVFDSPENTSREEADSTSVDSATTADTSGDIIFKLEDFDQEKFVAAFKSQMEKKYGIPASATDLRDKAIEVFYKIRARLGFADDEPITAYLILRRDYINSFLKSNVSSYYDGKLSRFYVSHYIDRVVVETEDGAMKNITVKVIAPEAVVKKGRSPRKYIEFKNQFPISISGKFDPEKFTKVKLYCYGCYGVTGLSRYIKLSDLMTLDIVLENDKEDYSPSNRKVTLTPSNPIVELKKEKRSKILEVAAFSDFVGLDQEQPNGLIQFEAKRKINIVTKSNLLVGERPGEDIASQIDLSDIVETEVREDKKYSTYKIFMKKNPNRVWDPSKIKALDTTIVRRRTHGESFRFDTIKQVGVVTIKLRKRPFRSPYWNVFSSVEPRLLFSKIEENNRFLDSTKFADHKIDPVRLFQYQRASFGANLNLLRFSFPQLKLQWNAINAGAYWFRTRIGNPSDSSGENSVPLNSGYYIIGTNVVFRPDNRWGASMGGLYQAQPLEFRL
jgi:hypothetical protein